MKSWRPLVIAGALVFWTFTLLAQTAVREKEVLQLEDRRSAAIASHDVAFLRNLYADDFRGFAANGAELDKAGILELLGRDDGTLVFHRENTSVRVFGDTTLSTGELVGKSPAGEVVVHSRYSHLYVLMDGHWKLEFGQGTSLIQPQVKR